MENEVTKRIFEYDNYRFFLRDYFQEQKLLKDSFSHRYFAKKAGFASSSFFSHVIDGKRSLTEESLAKMVKGVGLRGRKATFFKELVLYNQATTAEEREAQYQKLIRMRKSSELYSLNKNQYAYYDEWYYPVIRELVLSTNWHEDFALLGTLVIPTITPETAKQAVELLCEIELLQKNSDGTYLQTNGGVTSQDIPAVVTRKTRKEFINLAERAMEELPISERLISGCTVLLSQSKFDEVVQKMNELRLLIVSDAIDEKVSDSQKVYQCNFQAFPLSESVSLTKDSTND